MIDGESPDDFLTTPRPKFHLRAAGFSAEKRRRAISGIDADFAQSFPRGHACQQTSRARR
jgi:hypothetical protein